MHAGPETASEPMVEIVALGNNRYVAYENGFTGAVDFVWSITPGLAGTDTPVSIPGLTATNLSIVDITGATPGVRGALSVVASTSTVRATADIITPYYALDDDRGALTTVDGPVEIP